MPVTPAMTGESGMSGIVGAGFPGKDPASFPGLTGNWDFEDESTVFTDVDGVNRWNNLAQAGKDVEQTTGTLKPALTATGILADDDDNLFGVAGVTMGDFVGDVTSFTMLVTMTTPTVVDTDSGTGTGNDAVLSTTSTRFQIYFRSSGRCGVTIVTTSGFETAETASGSLTLGSKQVIAAVFGGGNLSIKLTDQPKVSVSSADLEAAFLARPLRMLTDGNGALSCKGPVRYIHMFDQAHSDDDIADMIAFQVARDAAF